MSSDNSEQDIFSEDASATTWAVDTRGLSAEELPWPLVSIEFLTGGRGQHPRVLEVGLAMLNGPGEPIKLWSTIVYRNVNYGDENQLNSLDPFYLQYGKERYLDSLGKTDPADAIEKLNSFIGFCKVAFIKKSNYKFTTGILLNNLANSANRRFEDDYRCKFLLADWSMLIHEFNSEQWQRDQAIYEFDFASKPDWPVFEARDNLKTILISMGIDFTDEEWVGKPIIFDPIACYIAEMDEYFENDIPESSSIEDWT